MTTFVYLIESECGRVKIGHSGNPVGRLNFFALRTPRPVRLIAIWPGALADEQGLHSRFAPYRSHNEWFRAEGDFAEFVEAQRGLGVEAIPDWGDVTWANRRDVVNRSRRDKMKALWADPSWEGREARTRAFRATMALNAARRAESLRSDPTPAQPLRENVA